MNPLYLDLHVLQTVPPSCVNRDDTGSPKTALYGGVCRARVSSQSWKHAMRLMFRELFAAEQIGVRTRRPVDLIVQELAALEYPEDKEKAAAAALEQAGIKMKKGTQTTEVLIFLSRAQAKALAQLWAQGDKTKENYRTALRQAPSIDMALFGRMVASDTSLSYDAAAQVAHSISTHEVRNEYDYFTAVDDLAGPENSGAAHVNTAEFNSATLYRYATVNVRELAGYLGADTPDVVLGFVKAFLLSMPAGKQNTFANRTVPDFAYLALRRDQPVNLAGAFERPVFTRQEGYVSKSVAALADYAQKTYSAFVGPPQRSFCLGTCTDYPLAQQVSMEQLLGELHREVAAYWNAKEGEK